MKSTLKGLLALAAVPVATATALTLPVSAANSAATSGLGARSEAPSPPPVLLRLPTPTGQFPVGTVSLHLVDRSRANPWAASPPYRELMVSVWYPARDVARYPVTPQMLPGAAAHYGGPGGYASTGYNVPPASVDWAATPASGHEGAPVARPGRRYPVVLYSPPAGEPRTWETTLVQDLASRGFVVVTVDHTYEASEVEFPGGQIIDGRVAQWFQQAEKDHDVPALLQKIVNVRVADMRFVLDELAALDTADGPGLPQGLRGALDLNRVGMFGVSAGGFTTAQAMYADPRIKAGVDLDGTVDTPLLPKGDFLSPVWRHGLNRPFMFMGDPKTTYKTVPSLSSFWAHTPGWHLDLTLDGADGENPYKDALPLIPQIARQLGLPRSFVTGDIGTVDPARALAAEDAYVTAFFDRWLNGRNNHLLDGPSPRYPDIKFVR